MCPPVNSGLYSSAKLRVVDADRKIQLSHLQATFRNRCVQITVLIQSLLPLSMHPEQRPLHRLQSH